jgi:putative ABC transport system substrate-binding protein
MRRRFFVAGLVGAALASLAAARAQQAAKVPRVGFLATGGPTDLFSETFLNELRKLGWIDGQNVVIDWKPTKGEAQRYDELVAELVRAEADVIVAPNPNAVLAARRATRTIPIVMVNTPDPVQLGIVTSLARPGGNVTGTSTLTIDLSVKQLQLLTELLPGASRIAVVSNRSNPWHPNAIGALEAASRSLGARLIVVTVHDPEEFERGFAEIARERGEAVLVLADPMASFHRAVLAELALRHRLPTAYGAGGHVEVGGLMSYWADPETLYRRTAAYVDKLLRGGKAADLPVEQPTKYKLVINLGTARALGLAIPPALLARADEVIE